jgi:hypothetical protein
MTGHDATHSYVGEFDPQRVRLFRKDGPLVQEWEDRPHGSTHTFWNGFVGVAAPWRSHLRAATVEVLSGRIAARTPSGTACRRKGGRYYAVLTFAAASDVRVDLRFDPNTGLPEEAAATTETGRSLVSELRYVRLDHTLVPTSWKQDGNAFRFSAISHGDSSAWPSMPRQPRTIRSRAAVRLVRNARSPATRGVLARADGLPATFMIDTGNSMTVVSAALARRLHLRPVTQEYMTAVGGFSRVDIAFVQSLTVGPVHLQDEPVAILPQAYGYDGAIGMALFSRADAFFRGETMTLSPSAKLAGRGALPVDTYDGSPIAAGFIGGMPATLLLDTGGPLQALFPSRYRAVGTKTSAGTSDCASHGLPALQMVAPYRFDDVRIGRAAVKVRACTTATGEIGPGIHFSIIGFPGMFGPVRGVNYVSSSLTLRT